MRLKLICDLSDHIMDSKLYQTIQNDPTFSKVRKSHSYDRRIEKRLKKEKFPVRPDLATQPLSVSFPCMGMYDIEMAVGRDSVGFAVSVDWTHRRIRRGHITILLFETPIIVVTEGDFRFVRQLEVWIGEERIGWLECGEDKHDYKLRSRKGDATVALGDDIYVYQGKEHHQFEYCFNTDYLPNIFAPLIDWITGKKRVLLNDSIVYQPAMTFCDPIAVMGFVLAQRMIYQSGDFG